MRKVAIYSGWMVYIFLLLGDSVCGAGTTSVHDANPLDRGAVNILSHSACALELR